MKKLSILGSTGSIGCSTLEVVDEFPELFEVVGLAAGSSVEKLAEQARATGARYLSVHGEGDAARLKELVAPGVEVAWGEEGMRMVATAGEADMVVSSIVGAAGLLPTYEAIVAGKDVAVANKETLVVAGEAINEAAKKSGAHLLPVDSEHSAIFQALYGHNSAEVKKLIITASGGPFRGWSAKRLKTATVEQALAHPNWSMGRKITIDSATLMNKGLEVIEAHYLFGFGPEAIDVIIHPQSVVHSMVEFIDGAVIAQLGVPDMRGPIGYALHYPDRLPLNGMELDLTVFNGLTFEEPDGKAFPCLGMAYEALRAQGTYPAVLSGANEIGVEAFLEGRIGFQDIPGVVGETLDAHTTGPGDSIEAALEADRWARETARSIAKAL